MFGFATCLVYCSSHPLVILKQDDKTNNNVRSGLSKIKQCELAIHCIQCTKSAIRFIEGKTVRAGNPLYSMDEKCEELIEGRKARASKSIAFNVRKVRSRLSKVKQCELAIHCIQCTNNAKS
jgi:hypothetical protein